MIDTNTWLNASRDLVVEFETSKQLAARQVKELRQLRDDLAAARKAQETAQALVEQTERSKRQTESDYVAVLAENRRLAAEHLDACRRCESMEGHPDVVRKKATLAAEVAKARAAQAAHAQAEAERLAHEAAELTEHHEES